MGFVEAFALGVVVVLLVGGVGGFWWWSVWYRAETKVSATRAVSIATEVVTHVDEPVLSEACRRAAQAAVLDPDEVIGDGGPLERLVRGRHEARQERLSEEAAARIGELEGTVAAGESDEAAARAAADRARGEWDAERATVAAAADRIDGAREEVRQGRRERNALSLLTRGYVSSPVKWIFVVAVALALAPLVYLSMAYLDDPFVQIIVTVAASASILVVEHALGIAMAHAAQRVPGRTQLLGLLGMALLVGIAIIAAEVFAGATRDQAGTIAANAGTFDAAEAARGVSATQTDVSMTWTVPLGIAATFGGSLIVAMYLLGGPGRELRARIKDAKARLAAAREDHHEVEPRAREARARLERAEQAADAIAGRTARAREEISGARAAEAHGRDAEDGDRIGNLAAAEIAYHAERARRAEQERERIEAEARKAEEAERAEAAQLRLEERGDAAQLRLDERTQADHRERADRKEARRARRIARKKARRAARRERRNERFARIGRVGRAVGAHASDGLRLGGPATTAGLLAAGLGAPAIVALAAGSGGLTAAHLLTRSRRSRSAAPVTATAHAEAPATSAVATVATVQTNIAEPNGTSINGFRKEHA